MENPCTILFFGDSITKEYVPTFESRLRERYQEIELEVLNAGVIGDTTRDGIERMQSLIDLKPTVVVIGFGMNDWRKGVTSREYKKNIIRMVDEFENIGARVILNTVTPSYDFSNKEYNNTEEYSQRVREVSLEKRVKVADIEAEWTRSIKNKKKGLRDDLHPNTLGYDVILELLLLVVPRQYTTLLWQYNGRDAVCNYRCFYCYYIGLHQAEDTSFGSIDEWHKNLKYSFGNQKLIVYLGFGEPSLGKAFPEIIRMFEREKNWQLRIISNIDTDELRAAAKTLLAIEGRLHIVGSFHPSQTTREKYIESLRYFRGCGIEIPTVYVAHPKFIDHFNDDIEFFRREDFLVHVRRFQGKFRKKVYPWAYTDEEIQIFSKYMDDCMLKYMASGVSNHNKLTFSGYDFFVMDNAGNVGYDVNLFEPYTKYRGIFGNINSRNFRPLTLPEGYPGEHEGTDDGIANIIEHNMKQLEDNHVMSFARQGGVYKDLDGSVVYKNEHTDFNDRKVRAELNIPPRGILDYFAILRYSSTPGLSQYIKQKMYGDFRSRIESRPALHSLLRRIKNIMHV
jgi:acyl-CoA thioesterase-1